MTWTRFAVALLLSLICVSAPARGEDAPTSHRWRYQVLSHVAYPSLSKIMWIGIKPEIPETVSIPDAMNMLGDKGWELIAVVPDDRKIEPYVTSYYFKRPAAASPPK